MKRLALALLLLATPALAAPVVLCDPATHRALSYDASADTALYLDNPAARINPPALRDLLAAGVPVRFWACVKDDVREMTAQEKSDLLDAETAAALAAHKAEARSTYDGEQGEALRALVKVLLDEINTLRAASPIPVASITRSGTTGTITTRWPHGLSGLVQITVNGADVAAYNGTVTATVTGASTLTYTVSGNPTTPAAGSIALYPANGAMAARTLAQAKAAIQNVIDAGTVAE